ncbi:MAG TPA: dinitrogenase iron-molybdenum cofactor biosynthesis protein [Candidatus Eisenbacteria bacterium]|uniref:Dinitrogenase iron-molybdenum cofactor biosynthesis protein n=1 Tax=Eiseniibacteriota bacterium TaxID=2212470 RepID=A0A7V2AWE4_UNCEI|nr:dinitrogenase iron-molybdenum cofactor biosynthesis protein [Candidatus Eisenbacteria bacterium]
MATRLAIPAWKGTVSTVFDFAGSALLIDVQGRREISRREIQLPKGPVQQRAALLSGYGVRVLICGAISRPLAWLTARSGIRIVAFVSGPIDEVVAAYLCGRLSDPRFLLPGSPPGIRRRWQQGYGLRGRGG